VINMLSDISFLMHTVKKEMFTETLLFLGMFMVDKKYISDYPK